MDLYWPTITIRDRAIEARPTNALSCAIFRAPILPFLAFEISLSCWCLNKSDCRLVKPAIGLLKRSKCGQSVRWKLRRTTVDGQNKMYYLPLSWTIVVGGCCCCCCITKKIASSGFVIPLATAAVEATTTIWAGKLAQIANWCEFTIIQC